MRKLLPVLAWSVLGCAGGGGAADLPDAADATDVAVPDLADARDATDPADLDAGPADTPDGADLPDLPGVPDAPDLPGAPDLPDTPDGADLQDIPDLQPPACVGAPGLPPWPSDADPRFLRGPYLQDVRDDHAVVVFRPAAPLSGAVCVSWYVTGSGAVDPSKRCGLEPDARGQYEVRIEALPPDAEVTYHVSVGDEPLAAGPFAFRSAPPPDRPQRILVMSDLHATKERTAAVLSKIVARALAAGVDFALGGGDYVDQPEEAQFDDLFDGLRPLLHRVPMFTAIGNHEIRSPRYFNAFVLPEADPPDADAPELYYAFRRGNTWIGVLDVLEWQLSFAFGEPLPQVQWLARALDSEAARTARWRLLVIHLAPWGRNWAPCDDTPYYGEESLRELLVPLARDKGVSAIFSGDFHDYEHGTMDGVELFIVGGAGAGLENVTCPAPEGLPEPWTSLQAHHSLTVETGCDALTMVATDLDGLEIDRVVVPYGAL